MLISIELTCNKDTELRLYESHSRKETRLQPERRKSNMGYVYKFMTPKLRQNTNYTYQISSPFLSEAYSFIFNPSPKDDKPIVLAGFADNQRSYTVFNRLVGLAKEHKPEYLFHGGDSVQNVDDQDDWRSEFLSPLVSKKNNNLGSTNPMIFTRGNHDWNDRDNKYLFMRENKWFATTVSNSRWLVLESNYDDEGQDKWLQAELRRPSFQKAKFKIILVHIAPYIEYWDPITWNQKGEKYWGAFIRNRYVPLFEKHGVDLVIGAHQHNYQRGLKNKLIYSIIGGGGGGLDYDRVENYGFYNVTYLNHFFIKMQLFKKKLVWEAISINNQTVDRFVIDKSQ